MPSSAGRTPAARAASTMRCKFSFIAPNDWPRKPSLPPSSMSTQSGRMRRNAAGKRAAPPAVVSPLMLSLTNSTGRPRAAKSRASTSTHDWPPSKP